MNKLDTFIIFSKGLAFMLVGIFTPWTGALAQWINTEEWPPRIIWVGVILPLSMIGGGSAWVAFTSGSWKEYQQGLKNGNGKALGTEKPTSNIEHPTSNIQ